MTRVAIVGIGRTNARATTPDLSYREMIFEAATKAYQDAGLKHTDMESFVCNEEDFMVGYSITDEYTPDQLGAVQKPVQTVAGDFLQGLATAYMMIQAGLFKTVVVESHSKASNVKSLEEVHSFALDPAYNRPLQMNANFVAGLEMNRYLHDAGINEELCAEVVVRAKHQALKNPAAAWGADITTKDVLRSEAVSSPLKELDLSQPTDGAIVVILASEDVAKKGKAVKPIWIKGLSWCSDTPWLETRNWSEAPYARLAAEKAYKMGNVKDPLKEIDLFEIDDSYSYKLFQHADALLFKKAGESKTKWNELPLNMSGGSLGYGNLFEANGGIKLYEACLQLRGQAGLVQVPNVKRALVQSWRGVPTTTGAVIILEN